MWTVYWLTMAAPLHGCVLQEKQDTDYDPNNPAEEQENPGGENVGLLVGTAAFPIMLLRYGL